MTQWNRRQLLKSLGITTAALSTAGCGLKAKRISADGSEHKSLSDSFIRLSSNENRFAPSDKIKQAMINAIDQSYLYTPAYYKGLKTKIAKKENVNIENVLLVSGSNEGLRLTGLIYGRHGGEVVTSAPTYKALISYAQEFGGSVNAVPLNKDLKYDLDKMESLVSHRTSMVFFCNPNNPTGTIVDPQKALDFCSTVSTNTMVFSDEAYYDYIEESDYPSMVPLVMEGKNVIVSKTFSKVYGMAGVRVGYLIASPQLVNDMKPKVMSYVNAMGLAGASAALDDDEFYRFSLKKNRDAKEHIYRVANDLSMEYVKSHTNFVFVKTGMHVHKLDKLMLAEGIKVGRPFEPLTDWCRISTGTDDDMAAWETAMRKIFV